MFEHVPYWLGAMLREVRAGHTKLAVAQPELAGLEPFHLASPAFGPGGRLPTRFTADGAGVSPPLVWHSLPAETQHLALLVEDPDAPLPRPLLHALIWCLPATRYALDEGAMMRGDGAAGRDAGPETSIAHPWLAPDPPTGHGSHDYVFELFALRAAPSLGDRPSRSAVIEAMAGEVLGAAVLVGTYDRGTPAPLEQGLGAGPIDIIARRSPA